jgi:hypothetical protein
MVCTGVGQDRCSSTPIQRRSGREAVGWLILDESRDSARFRVFGTRDGVQIKVVVEPEGEGVISVYSFPGPPR